MKDFLKGIFQGSPAMWMVIAVMMVASSILMFSAISTVAYKTSNYLDPFYGHITHLALGVFILLIMSRFPYSWLRRIYIIGLPLIIIILFLMPFIGVTLNGGTRALRLGGFDLQPQEFAKLFIIMFLADFLTLYQANGNGNNNLNISQEERVKKEKIYFWSIIGVVCVTCIPIAMQNLSTAVMIATLTFAMMLVGRVDWKKLTLITVSVIATVVIIVAVLLNISNETNNKLPGHMPSIKGRIEKSLEDLTTPDDKKVYVINDGNRQRMHGKIAIANGRTPTGPGNSIQRDYLPLAFSDFIFAILVEESGWFGVILVLLSYLSLLYIAGKIIRKCGTIYPALMVMGLTFMVVMQAFISMCVAVGIGPVTGQPLPLFSKGGSSIVSTCLMLGIVLSISREINKSEGTVEIEKNEETPKK